MEMTDASDLARRIADTLLSREGTGPAWGIKIDGADAGYSLISMQIREDMLNGHRSAHGGMLFAFADTAFAYACNSRNVTTVAQSANIVFLSPGKAGEQITAEAVEKSLKGRTGVYHVTVRGEDERVIAEFHGVSRSVGGEIV